jgi:hypothetical protein
MKVEFCKSIEVESEVDITAGDIAAALEELFVEAGRSMEFSATDTSRRFGVRQFVVAALNSISAVSDEMIASLMPPQRELIAVELRKLAERFNTRLGEAGE